MKRTGLLAVLVIVIVVLGGTVTLLARKNGYFGGSVLIKDSGSNISDYSAVFLTNGQVYFGKMYTSPSAVVDLQDIYYLQVNQSIQPGGSSTSTTTNSSTQQPDIQLIKLGDELHGPADHMTINRQQVLFTESMKSDSKVVKAISDYKAKQ